jgi:DnaA family protein
MELSPQLSLNLELADNATWQQYYPGPNNQAFLAVQQLARGEGENFIYLHGLPGTGKTHLLQAACQEARQQHLSAIYLSLKDVQQYSETLLDNLESLALVCIDDLQGIAGQYAWEEKIFNLFNAIWSNGGRLLLAANAVPNELGLVLPDLLSRLNWALRFRLQTLSEEEVLVVLKTQAEQRGLILSDEVGQFLLRRAQRDLGGLLPLFQVLDQASLIEQRRLTVPFVKQVLDL